MQFSGSDSDYNSDSSDVELNTKATKRPRNDNEKPPKGPRSEVNNTGGDNLFDFSDGDASGSEEGDENPLERKRGARTEGGARNKKRRGGDDDDDSDGGMVSDNEQNAQPPAPTIPLTKLLADLISLLNADESVGEAYTRLTTEAAAASPKGTSADAPSGTPTPNPNLAKKAMLHTTTQQLLIQHSVPTMGLERGEVVVKFYEAVDKASSAVDASAASDGTATVSSLPTAYALEWAHSKGKLFGPFTAQQMQAWRDKGVFKQKKASTKDVNASGAGNAPWHDADNVEKY